ncbi:hypothetical protein CEE36_06805 [candidate division TA06 bacterium B3_TA06]|uniref:Secretion system C-terminal sorting domain-containing protein n=1 Tax=candidate division TA06 bacterium B3_TA06 TaxID=2012487 RepID=A0A532V746_UNCT6|nr:MAG: hypothetical protein CEE36_06805 [candidate division TA06 bacterium B3_TA06]
MTKKVIGIAAALVLLAVAVPLFGQWQGDTRITNNTGSSYTTYRGGWCIAADDANVHIAWRDHTTTQRIRYFTFPIGSPTTTPNGEAVSTSSGYDPSIAVHDGTVDVSWYYYAAYDLYTREKNGSWGPIINHGVYNQSCYYPAIAFDSDGDLHNVFNRYSYTSGDARGYSVYYQRKNSGAGSYSSPVRAFDPHSDGGSASSTYYAYYPSICITSDDVIHISVAHNNGYRLKHVWSTDNGATWNHETIGGTYFAYYSYGTSICHDSEDNLYIAYVGYTLPRQVYVATNASGSWVSTQVSNSTYNYTWYPSICCDTNDNVWVSWDDRSGMTYEIHYNKYDAVSGSWEGDQALTLDDGQYSRYSNIAADENGNVHICWYDRRDGNYEVYYNWYHPLPPGVYLTEDFEGSFPPAGWSTTTESGSNQWFRNDYWSRPNYAGGSGYCADNDDDAAGSGAPLCEYNCLTSPSIDLSEVAVVTLEYTMSYNHGSNAEARVEVVNSTGSWIVVNYRDDVDPTGPGKVETYNISQYAAGESDVRIRFVYHEFAAGHNGWFEVDDVEVRECAGVDTLLTENFNGAWSTTSPPAGWTINYGSSVTRDDWNRWYRAGNYCAGIYYYFDTETDELISPVIDCSGEGEVYLAVDHYYSHYMNYPYTAQWLGSTDGGATWPHVIWDYDESSYGNYPFTRDSLDISWAAGESQVAINFYGDGYSYNINYWYVDNVLMVGFADCGLPPPYVYLDLKLVNIIRPRKEEEPDVPFTPSIKIFNNVDTVAHTSASCKIKDLTTQTIVYDDVLSNVPLEPGYNIISGFKAFTPEGDKTYNAFFIVEHPDDINPDDNRKDKNFTTAVGVDVTPFAVLAPTDPQVNQFEPSARYAEKAGAEETDASLICEIKNDAEEVVHGDTLEHTFAANDTFTATFNKSVELEEGPYTITFWAEERGGNISNPPLSMGFNYSGIAETPLPERTSLEVLGTRVNFTLATATNVNLRIYDVAGNMVATLASGTYGAGYYSLNWNTSGVAAGVYFVRMITPEFNATRKVLILH